MSIHFNKVKLYYQKKMWSIDRVRNAVMKQWITPEEFKIITGKEYYK